MIITYPGSIPYLSTLTWLSFFIITFFLYNQNYSTDTWTSSINWSFRSSTPSWHPCFLACTSGQEILLDTSPAAALISKCNNWLRGFHWTFYWKSSLWTLDYSLIPNCFLFFWIILTLYCLHFLLNLNKIIYNIVGAKGQVSKLPEPPSQSTKSISLPYQPRHV